MTNAISYILVDLRPGIVTSLICKCPQEKLSITIKACRIIYGNLLQVHTTIQPVVAAYPLIPAKQRFSSKIYQIRACDHLSKLHECCTGWLGGAAVGEITASKCECPQGKAEAALSHPALTIESLLRGMLLNRQVFPMIQ